MKNSLKLSLLLAGAMILAIPALRAEEPSAPPSDQPKHGDRGPGHGGPGAWQERAAKELGLTADQAAKWKAIGEQEKVAVDAIRADTSLSKEAKWAKVMEATKPFADQRRAVLTAEQQKKFDEMQAKMRERGPRGPKKDN
jgi:Spy/CpxP family protein refolding chaperone